MPGRDDMDSPEGRSDAEREAQRLSRRSVLRGAAGAGAAGIAASALAFTSAPAFAAATRPARPAGGETKDAEATGQIIVHVRDVSTGEIDVFRGTSQTRVHDRELAARLTRASR
ncbi:MAG: hypothetical protein ABR926_23630 [Streptosporangiaceae bacterium]